MRASELIDEGARAIKARSANLSWKSGQKQDATDLLAHALGHEPDPDEEVSAAMRRRYERYIERRAAGEPLPRILGYIEFLGLKMTVRPGAFVPRITSEHLATSAIKRLRRRTAPVAIDLATGIGPVALAVAHAVPTARVFGVDVNKTALRHARENARELGIMNATFLAGDLFEPLPEDIRGGVDLITIHPPYVARGDVRTLPREIREFEPKESLTDASSDGLGMIRRVCDEAHDYLRPGGWLQIEIGGYLARSVVAVMRRAGYTDVTSTPDELKLTRVVAGKN